MKSVSLNTKIQKVLIVILLVFIQKAGNGKPHLNYTKTAPAKLKQVFSSEVTSNNKDVLKLYDDNTYELLFFQIKKKKPLIKRERGTYRWKNSKLILSMKGKKQIKEHPTRLAFIEGKGLYEWHFFNHTSKGEPLYALSSDKKYWEATYFDSVYGEITNDKKAFRKIIEKKPEYKPVAAQPKDTAQTSEENVTAFSLFGEEAGKSFLSKDSLKRLKAVFVVGPVEQNTKEFIEEQKKNAAYLKSLGVKVIELYHPNVNWKDVVKASEGANILVYSGHGRVSLFCLTDGLIYGDVIKRDLKLHKDAIVIFNHACESAGSSAADTKDIGQKEAFRRVGDYAKPFIESDAAVYYANNYYDCLIPFFMSFFKHTPIKEIYTQQASPWQKIEARKKYQYNSNYEISVSSKNGTSEMRNVTWYTNKGKVITKEKYQTCKSYDVAYVGKPNFTVNDFFK